LERGQRTSQKKPTKKPNKHPELTKEEIAYNRHLIEIGAVEKRTWFTVFVRLLVIVWILGFVAFIFMWITTGFQQPPTFPEFIEMSKGAIR